MALTWQYDAQIVSFIYIYIPNEINLCSTCHFPPLFQIFSSDLLVPLYQENIFFRIIQFLDHFKILFHIQKKWNLKRKVSDMFPTVLFQEAPKVPQVSSQKSNMSWS